ncbi:amino acid adenylation domain-containing protein [Saccharothrix sp. 6-C]|uniref:Amino acid adenylation domain-containing protein n=1 Tax=Saccharothrix texasensis TaxID=103734 RepID=A0A3N1GZ94_9PSEU|nr:MULTISPECIES: non-ribosomal peptide synthetase [Saccharothrix]QQQ79993.1 amino acid adenylation domain-containing protein [Saccharothrix sp. 6-C]ROP35578.1 amino acid adenylation domain-containing protein [Saccharothrix texasensis]
MSLDEYALSVLGPTTNKAGFTTDSFIALGGDSLRAMRLAALAQEGLGLRLSVADLLSSTPLGKVLANTVAAAPAQASAAVVEPATRASALTPTQRGMWLIENVLGGSTYNLVFTFTVDTGTLDREVFGRAVAAATARHASLRTLLRERDGEVVPVVLDEVAPDVVDIAHDGPDFEEFVRATAAEHGRVPFDLTAAPPLRYLFVAGAAGRQAVVLVAHHVLLDGWAVGLLAEEVFASYRALKAGEPLPFTEAAPTTESLLRRHERDRDSGEWDRLADFWLDRLDGAPTVLEVPTDRPRPAVQDPAGERLPLDLGGELTALVEDRARELGVTPFALLLASYGLALSRWTGVGRLLVGVSLYGRDTAELTRLVAVAGNLVPVLLEVDDDASAVDYLRSVQESLALSIEAGALPFDELVTRLGLERGLGAHPLVQVSFGMHDQLVPQRIDVGDVGLRVEEGHGGGAQFDLSLLFGRSRPALGAQLEFATALWDEADARAFLADFTTAVRELATADGRLEDLRCLSTERRAALDSLNGPRHELPLVTADELVRRAARRSPDAVAVREDDLALTYAQLVGAAAEQARRLRELGVGRGDRVLVALDRSIAEVVAVLGAAWAGAAYVGVDLAQPESQVRHIVAKAAPKAALVSSPEAVAHLGVPTCATWEPSWRPATEEPAATGPDDLAYIAFTSGSTGLPKGVAVPHRAIVRLVHEPDFVRFTPDDRVLRLSPLAFDASTLELWGPLAGGAALEVNPPGLSSPTELAQFLLDRGVTVAWLTAGLFRLVEEFAPAGFGGLRQLITGGDVVPHAHVARVLERHPGIVVTNGYGPTENTTFTATHTVTSAAEVDGPLPIGTPLRGTRVHVLDRRHRVVPPGAVGELYAAGDGLADGYVDDEAESARGFGHFSPDVPERLYRTGDLVRIDRAGRLRFLGRRDDQVKLRGYRIELSAIADVLAADPRVRDAAVVVTDGDSADKRLVAAIVPADRAVGTDELRDLVADRLPAYMVPSLWAVVDQLPVTRNGKVDRRALTAVAAPAGQRVAAPEPDPLGVAPDLFARVLDRPVELTGDTDFFTIGGNSMGAVRLLRLVRDELGVSVRLRDFLLAPTPAGLNRLIAEAAGS